MRQNQGLLFSEWEKERAIGKKEFGREECEWKRKCEKHNKWKAPWKKGANCGSEKQGLSEEDRSWRGACEREGFWKFPCKTSKWTLDPENIWICSWVCLSFKWFLIRFWAALERQLKIQRIPVKNALVCVLYPRFSASCYSCQLPIVDDGVFALGRLFHTGCFR